MKVVVKKRKHQAATLILLAIRDTVVIDYIANQFCMYGNDSQLRADKLAQTCDTEKEWLFNENEADSKLTLMQNLILQI